LEIFQRFPLIPCAFLIDFAPRLKKANRGLVLFLLNFSRVLNNLGRSVLPLQDGFSAPENSLPLHGPTDKMPMFCSLSLTPSADILGA
jgi:hypothetical protein